jgi:hypothetical protein
MSESEELNVLDLPDDQVNDAIAAEMARLDSEESAEDFTEEGGIEVDEQEEIQEEETEEGESNDEPSEDS